MWITCPPPLVPGRSGTQACVPRDCPPLSPHPPPHLSSGAAAFQRDVRDLEGKSQAKNQAVGGSIEHGPVTTLVY